MAFPLGLLAMSRMALMLTANVFASQASTPAPTCSESRMICPVVMLTKLTPA